MKFQLVLKLDSLANLVLKTASNENYLWVSYQSCLQAPLVWIQCERVSKEQGRRSRRWLTESKAAAAISVSQKKMQRWGKIPQGFDNNFFPYPKHKRVQFFYDEELAKVTSWTLKNFCIYTSSSNTKKTYLKV